MLVRNLVRFSAIAALALGTVVTAAGPASAAPTSTPGTTETAEAGPPRCGYWSDFWMRAWYRHCGDRHARVVVYTLGGTEYHCLPPGDTLLGWDSYYFYAHSNGEQC